MLGVFGALLNSVIQAYGSLGLLAVMIIQTIIAPIPSEALLMFAGAIGIKLFDIVIFGGIGMIIGSIIAFYLARIGGKPIINKLIGKKWIGRVDRWVEKRGTKIIFLTRLIPLIPFDLISYMAGITKLKFKNYLIATVLGAFPRTLMLAIMGLWMKEILTFIGFGLEITFIIGILGFILLAYLDRKGYLDSIERKIMNKIIRKNTT